MRPTTLISVIGFFVLIAATFCPMLRVFHVVTWNVYQLNQPYGMLLMLVGVIGVVATVLGQAKITKISAWVSLALVALLYVAAVLKVKTTFSFIPFKVITGFLTRQINFKWGWLVLFAGAIMAVFGSSFSKNRGFRAR